MSGTCRSTGKAVYRLLRNVKEQEIIIIIFKICKYHRCQELTVLNKRF